MSLAVRLTDTRTNHSPRVHERTEHMTTDHNPQPDTGDAAGRPTLEATVVDHPDTLDVHIHVTDATGGQTLTAASIASAVLTRVVDDLFPQMDTDDERAQFFLEVYGRLTREMTSGVREHLMDNYPGVVAEMETPDDGDDTEADQ